ncbi:questin oxidase family protein [Streptomyces sp. I05A-00742]|uniref:questin oxidase family protein n=1 Tax=Streptomyces sp. I05A-00742 TaxID=2732853 RepID=UPI00289B94D7|nr:questin oxidase family protein [Streptomyces sp. I05A-00742]
MNTSPLIERLLDDRSHHIEFNGHLSNHVKHAVVALARLGAAPERIKDYYESYATLTTYGYGLEPARPAKSEVTDDNWREYLGRRYDFTALCEYFDRKERELGLDEVVRRYVPELVPGWVGAFTHATIHLGWALDIGNRWMAVEGLAYMVFSYVPSHPERAGDPAEGPADAGPVDSLLRVAGAWDADREALTAWAREIGTVPENGPLPEGIHPELARSGLQYRNARMLAEGHPLIDAVPSWIAAQPVETSWEQLYEAVTVLYLSRPGDFVLLHLLTSLHALEQIAARLSEEQHRTVLTSYWTGMLGVVFALADFPKRDKLAALHAAFAGAADAGDTAVWAPDWRLTTARSFEEEEEHNPKLVYVMRRMWERTGQRSLYRHAAAQFTATPALPPSFEQPPNE